MSSTFERRHAELLRLGGFQPRQFSAGSPFTPDSQHEALILVGRGRMLVTVVDPSGREELCALRGVDSLLGFESIDGTSPHYSLWALTELELWLAPRSAADALVENLSSLQSFAALAARAYRRQLGERLMMSRPATARLSHFLLTAEQEPPVPGMATPAPIGLPRRVMARVLAMRPETLSRALRRLEADGAIDASADIRILDRERLKAASQ